jgi:dGTPase
LFTLEDLRQLPLIGPCIAAVDARWPGLEAGRREHEALRRFFGLLVEDVLAASRARLAAADPKSAEDIRRLGAPVIRFTEPTFGELKKIRAFLYVRMYRHWAVQRMRRKARRVVEELFATFAEAPELMPAEWNACKALDQTGRARVVADYIAGMTDRFALQEHRKLTDPMVKG